MKTLKIFFDGSSHGNPGPSGIGIIVFDESGRVLDKFSKFIGFGTNNEAEYHALNKAIRIDALLPPSTLIEVKTREVKPIYDVALAAYAIAFESQYEVPVNYAVLINLRFDRNYDSFKIYERAVPIGDALRQRFVEVRDGLTRIVEEREDPGLPERCDPECPYFRYCSGEDDGG